MDANMTRWHCFGSLVAGLLGLWSARRAPSPAPPAERKSGRNSFIEKTRHAACWEIVG